MKLGQGYVFTGVCHSVNRGEYLTRYTPLGPSTPPGPGTPPWDQVHPPGPGTPPDQVQDQVHPPGPGTPPWDQVHPQTRYTPSPDQVHPPGPGTPPRDQVHPPPARSMLGDTVNVRAVRILLECNLVMKWKRQVFK